MMQAHAGVGTLVVAGGPHSVSGGRGCSHPSLVGTWAVTADGAAGTEYVQCTACSLRCTYGHSDNAGRTDSARRASREKLPPPGVRGNEMAVRSMGGLFFLVSLTPKSMTATRCANWFDAEGLLLSLYGGMCVTCACGFLPVAPSAGISEMPGGDCTHAE